MRPRSAISCRCRSRLVGQFLTFTAEELKALDVESSKVVDLEKFVAGGDIAPGLHEPQKLMFRSQHQQNLSPQARRLTAAKCRRRYGGRAPLRFGRQCKPARFRRRKS